MGHSNHSSCWCASGLQQISSHSSFFEFLLSGHWLLINHKDPSWRIYHQYLRGFQQVDSQSLSKFNYISEIDKILQYEAVSCRWTSCSYNLKYTGLPKTSHKSWRNCLSLPLGSFWDLYICAQAPVLNATLSLRYSPRQFPNRSNSPSLARLGTHLSLWCGMGPGRLWLGDWPLATAWICWGLKLSEVFSYRRDHWFDLFGIEPFLYQGADASASLVTTKCWAGIRLEPSEILLLAQYSFLLESSIWHLETLCWVWSKSLDII